MKSFTISLLFLILSLAVLSGCHCHKPVSKTASSNSAKRDYAAEGYVQATVTLFDVDGCKWLITLADGKRVIPSPALADGFAIDGLKIWLKFAPKKGAVGICMAGTIVEITAIEKQ
jgi:hypothetical protein